MNRNFLTAILLLLSALFAACSSAGTQNSANTQAPANANAQNVSANPAPEDVVKLSTSKVEVQAGKSAQTEVKLEIKEGYHINANPASQYQIATQLIIMPTNDLTTGQPTYPPSMTKKFKFADQPLAVYEKEATIILPVNAPAGAAKKERTLVGRLRFQACDEQVCYPPRNLEVSIPVVVK